MKKTNRKILNPYTSMEDYNCFGCSPANDFGLKMEFSEEGEYVISHWTPKSHFGGYRKVLHGGIQATLLDEIASWAIQVKLKTAGVTGAMNVRYKKPVYTSDSVIIIKALIEKAEKRLAIVKTQLFNSSNELCSEGEIKYVIFPEDVAREKLYYPEFGKFFE